MIDSLKVLIRPPEAYYVAAEVAVITAIALAIFTSPPVMAAVLIVGALLTAIPLTLALRAKRIEQETLREKELKGLNLDFYDKRFHDEDHPSYDKYQKLKSRLWDVGYNVEETLQKIRALKW